MYSSGTVTARTGPAQRNSRNCHFDQPTPLFSLSLSNLKLLVLLANFVFNMALSASAARQMRVAELRAELEGRGLDAQGTKPVLLERLLKSLEKEDRQPSNPPASTSTLSTSNSASSTTPPAAVSTLSASIAASNAAATNSVVPPPVTTAQDLRATIAEVLAETLPSLLGDQLASTPQLPHNATPASSPHLLTSSASVPQKIRERILAGEYMDFNDLLTEAIGSSRTAPGILIQLHDGTPVHVADGSSIKSKRRHICDLSTWLEAWNVFLAVVVEAAPHRIQELLGYQSIITEANKRFVPAGWLEYDQQFRAIAANHPTTRWDSIESNTWQLCTTGKSRPACYHCSIVHPPMMTGGGCPFRPQRGSSVSGQSNGAGETCRRFNENRCPGMCGRLHVCQICRGQHARSDCPRNLRKTIVNNSSNKAQSSK